MSPLRQNVMAALEHDFQRGSGTVKVKHKGSHSNIFVYAHPAVQDMKTDKYSGVYFLIEFEETATRKKWKKDKRLKFWERTKKLQHGSLVCLVRRKKQTREHSLLFGIICKRDEKWLAPNLEEGRPTIGINFSCSGNPVPHDILIDFIGADNNDELLLVESASSYFSYEPILDALQEQDSGTFPFGSYLTAENALQPSPPQYLQPAMLSLDMTCLAMGGLDDAGKEVLSSVKLDRHELLRAAPHVTLDTSQFDALCNALQQEVCLIQGPPGTGVYRTSRPY